MVRSGELWESVKTQPHMLPNARNQIIFHNLQQNFRIFSDTYAHALQASDELLPLNAPGSASNDLPPPVFCPGLSGPQSTSVARVMADLPGHVCQHAAADLAYAKQLSG